MSDTFLPGSGFDTYEEQDKVLVGLCGGRGCRAAVRILQQQGFAVLTFTAEDTADSPAAPATLLPLLADGSEVLWLWGCGFAEGCAPDEYTHEVLTVRTEKTGEA